MGLFPLQNTPQSCNGILKDASHLDPNDPAKLSWDRVFLKKEPTERNAFTFWVRIWQIVRTLFWSCSDGAVYILFCECITCGLLSLNWSQNSWREHNDPKACWLFMEIIHGVLNEPDPLQIRELFHEFFLYHEYYFFYICMDITTLQSGHGSCTYFGPRHPFKPLRIYQRERSGPWLFIHCTDTFLKCYFIASESQYTYLGGVHI